MTKEFINLQRTKVYVFSDSVLCLEKIQRNPESNEAWRRKIEWITSSQSSLNFHGINGEPTEFEWNIFRGFDTLQLCGKVKDLLNRLGETPETFTGRILFVSMFNYISCGTKDNEEECLAHAGVVSLSARRFDEDACQQMDALADEDHTHHLIAQEYYHCKSDWWLRSNKTGSNTVPVEHRPNFKQALSTLRQLKEKRRSSTKPTMDTKLILRLGGAGKEHGGLLIPTKVSMETYPVLIEQGDL